MKLDTNPKTWFEFKILYAIFTFRFIFVCQVFSCLLVISWGACGSFKEFKPSSPDVARLGGLIPLHLFPAAASSVCCGSLWRVWKRFSLGKQPLHSRHFCRWHNHPSSFSPPVGRCRGNGKVSMLRPQKKNPPVALSFTWNSSTLTERSQHGRWELLMFLLLRSFYSYKKCVGFYQLVVHTWLFPDLFFHQ